MIMTMTTTWYAIWLWTGMTRSARQGGILELAKVLGEGKETRRLNRIPRAGRRGGSDSNGGGRAVATSRSLSLSRRGAGGKIINKGTSGTRGPCT